MCPLHFPSSPSSSFLPYAWTVICFLFWKPFRDEIRPTPVGLCTCDAGAVHTLRRVRVHQTPTPPTRDHPRSRKSETSRLGLQHLTSSTPLQSSLICPVFPLSPILPLSLTSLVQIQPIHSLFWCVVAVFTTAIIPLLAVYRVSGIESRGAI